MKSRPIIFGAHGVNAILDHRKSQTRRVIKLDYSIDWELVYFKDGLAGFHNAREYLDDVFKCPYGKIGDVLWVRETWAYHPDMPQTPEGAGILYKAGEDPDSDEPGLFWQMNATGIEHEVIVDKYKPSIFMPRWASRITLEITDIRVERIQDISDEDCKAEGADREIDHAFPAFIKLWDSINGKTNPWKNNDWVWALTFKQT